ncbi:XrtA/PEP-CTERM system TPR-repeat protein PrsT [Aquincola sp. MAHUQ-54]|uniref:XrtA/PEP-CTERM system TPR-repeat protein PrsT n=1 Tax=Aquincola agrisoli TaxID=3119538 RepID=A0AAW9Q4C1_9BURK
MPRSPLFRTARAWLPPLAFAAACTLCTPALAVADPKAARYYEDALSRYEKQDVKGAIIQLKNALQIDKNLLQVHVLLGKSLLANGEAATAEVAFLDSLRLGVSRAEVIVPLAESLIAQGKQPELLRHPRFAPTGLPVEVQAPLLLLRSAAASDMGEADEALKAVQQARLLLPQSADSWLAEVPIRLRTRQLAEATIAVERALALAPKSAEAWYQKGSIVHLQGDLRGALAAYGQALQLAPQHVEARVIRAGLYLDLRQDAEARADVAELQRLSPREPRGAYMRALLAERSGDLPAAQLALRQVTDLIDPVPLDYIRYRPQVLMLNGLAHFGLNERAKAKPYLELFQRMHGASAVSKLLAQIYLDEANTDRAIVLLETQLKATPGDGQALTLLAATLMARGQHARAADLMQEALATRDAPEFRTALGLSLIGSGQSASAMAELEAALQKDPHQTQAAVSLVGLYLLKGQSGKALALAEGLVQQQPASAGFQNLLGTARQRSGDAAGARKAYEQALRLDQRLQPPQLNLARLDAAEGQFDAAAKRLAALIGREEKNVDAMLEMATLSERRGQPVEVRRWLEKAAAATDGRDVRPGLSLVHLHLQAGQPEAALEPLRRLHAKAPQNLAVLLADARVRLLLADPVAARNTLATATRIANYDAPVQVEIANLQMAAGNPEGADYSLQKALSNQPDHLPALALQADLALRRGDIPAADAAARRIIQKAPRRAVGHSLLADVAMARQQPAAAIEQYRRAHQVEPSTETAIRLFSALGSQPDGARTALPTLEQWVKAQPKDRTALRALADGQARAGQFAAARASYEALLKLAPADARALNNLANVLLKLKDPSALQVAERALAASPTDADVIDTAGWAAFQAGQTDRALQLLRDARLRAPDNPDIRVHLATVLAQIGRRDEARAEIDAVLRSSVAFDGAAQAQALRRTLN